MKKDKQYYPIYILAFLFLLSLIIVINLDSEREYKLAYQKQQCEASAKQGN